LTPIGCCNAKATVTFELNMCDLNNYYILYGTGLLAGPCSLVGNCPEFPTTYCGTISSYSLYSGERTGFGVDSPAVGGGTPNYKPITVEVYKNSVLVYYDVLREDMSGPLSIRYNELIQQGSNNYLVRIYDQPPALSATPTPTKTKTPTPTITKSPTPTKTRP
jgi:hypothetical protein